LIRISISLTITIALIYTLNTKIGPVPSLGKFLDPVSGFWANAKSTPDIREKLEIPGLSKPVQVIYDELLIPHIFAQTDADLMLAQGYIHARHRLWQMEFQTHAAAGRLSEVFGDALIEYDRGQRRKGMVFGAEALIGGMSDKFINLSSKYTEGVNEYISHLSFADFPFEYKLLGYSPEPWTNLKIGLLSKYMSDMLNSHERDMENTNFVSLYGKELFDQIYPDVDNYDDPVVSKIDQWDFTPIRNDHVADNADFDASTAFNLIEKPDPRNGSNNWAVGPAKSASGNPLLSNDMHLGLNMPSLWFYVQLSSKQIQVFGHSLPGVPFVITGFTDSIAWGNTNAQRDLVDWYKIKFEDKSRNAYLLDGEYVPTRKVVEEIKVAGGEIFYDTVVYTLFGPVMYDQSFRPMSDKVGFARRWIDHDPSNNFKMFYAINGASNFEDFMLALDSFSTPAQNIVFASSAGDIAHRVQGKFPLKGYEEGKFVLDGTKSANNWSQYIPNEHNAFWKNPERGFVSSANQQPTDSTYPYYITSTMYESYRNRTINSVLRNDSSITVEDMKALQYNNFSLKAKESLPTMLQYLDSSGSFSKYSEMITLLKQWDYQFTAESKAATLYNLWYTKMYRDTWDEIQGHSLYYPTNYSFIRLILTDPTNIFFDYQGTGNIETAKEIITSAFEKVMIDLELDSLKEWSDYKGTYIRHLTRQRPLGVYNIKTAGASPDLVNATGPNHGPSQRIIVELDPKGVKAWGHYPGGQSGNPGSRFYDNMIDAWANGRYYELNLYSSPEIAQNPLFTQLLSPTK